MSTDTFDRMDAQDGRPSIPPEHLLKACLLMAFYSIRSERQFCERLQHVEGDWRGIVDSFRTFLMGSGRLSNQTVPV